MSSGWWVANPSGGPPVGPYSEQALKGLLDDGHILPDSHVWCEGRSAWTKLSETDDLKYLTATEEAEGRPKKVRRSMSPGAELAALEAEIEAMKAEGAATTDEDEDGARPGEGPATPEELEFEDDDGTTYVWDRRLRKYMPKDGQAAKTGPGPEDAGYDIDAMTYEPEEELIPTLAEARAAEAEVEAEEAQKRDRRKAGQTATTSGAKVAAAIDPAGTSGNGATAAGSGGGGPGGKKAAKATAAGAVAGSAAAGKTDGDGGGDGGASGSTEATAAAAEGGAEQLVDESARGKKGKGGKGKKEEQPANWFDLKINTNVYVTGLPLDVTLAEVSEVFSKCGVMKVDEKGHPRIKLYRDRNTGELKGDALVSYLKEPSVDLACRFLHQSYFRAGSSTVLTVEPAKFEMKGEKYQPKASNKKAKKKQLAQLEQRALGWGGFDDKAPPEKTTAVLCYMFAPDDFLENMLLTEELEQDVRSECGKLGVIEKVRIFKHNPQGVVTVRFRTPDAAQQCMTLMHGRYFGGRRLEAFMWDGFTNYNVKPKESAEEEQARLEAFARELEAKGDTAGAAAASAAAAAAGATATAAAAAAAAAAAGAPVKADDGGTDAAPEEGAQ